MNTILDDIKHCFTHRFSTDGRLYIAPGRINLIGEHTDYNSGLVLSGAINKSFYMMAAPNGTERCQIYSMIFNTLVTFDIDDSSLPEAMWVRYIFGMIKELQRLNRKVEGFDAVVFSDIPIGAGISSSAAFTSVTGVAVNDLFHLGLSRLEIAQAGQMCEHHYAGVRCGIIDQFASLFGEKGKLIKLDCRSLEFTYVPFAPSELSLVLLDTQVKHSLGSSAYNLRRAECEEGVAIIKKSYPAVESLRDVTLQILEAHRSELSPVLFNRCSYVVEENIRVSEACAALEKGDYVGLGLRMFDSHDGLKNKYDVSCPELNLLQDVARQCEGVLGAKMMGGGFGGCTINLVKEEAVEDFIMVCSERFNKKFWKELLPIEVNIGTGARVIA